MSLIHRLILWPHIYSWGLLQFYLFDEWDNLIGDYTGNSLANQRVIVKTRFLKIILFSNDDDSQGWGYSISKIEHVPYGVLQVLFPPYKKGD